MRNAIVAGVLVLCACSPAKPEMPQLGLQPIGYPDMAANGLTASGCSFVPQGGGLGAVFLAQDTRGVMKLRDHIVSLPAATDSPALGAGAHGRYASALYAATLVKLADAKTKVQGAAVSFDARLTIADARGQRVYDAPGTAQCHAM